MDVCEDRRIVVKLFNETIGALEKSLDFSSAKNRTIASNIANVDTPNYKAKNVTFENVLNDEVEKAIGTNRTHPKHYTFGKNMNQKFQVSSKSNTTYNHNGNNVDVDLEMSELAKNQIYYQSLVDRLNGEFGNIQTVLRGGN